MTADNIILDPSNRNITVYTTRVEESRIKKLVKISLPQTDDTADKKETKIMDLRRVDELFLVQGLINKTDKASFKEFVDKEKSFVMVWESESYTGFMEKQNIVTDNREDEHKVVQFSFVIAVDLTG